MISPDLNDLLLKKETAKDLFIILTETAVH